MCRCRRRAKYLVHVPRRSDYQDRDIRGMPDDEPETLSAGSVKAVYDAAWEERMRAVWTAPFRFLDLPAEMRVRVYNELLPHNKTIKFEIVSNWSNKKEVFVAEGYANTRWRVVEEGKANLSVPTPRYWGRHTTGAKDGISLFLVSKAVSAEARAVLYSANTFKLEVDSIAHTPVSLQSPLIFGPLGLDHRLCLLRNLRSIHLDVSIIVYLDGGSSTTADRWPVIRHRARLQHFVHIIKQHADDANQRSLLKMLRVVHHRSFSYPGQDPACMFALEELAALRGVEEVDVTGVEPWFARCLECVMTGKGGDVREVDWPLVEITRQKGTSKKRKKAWVTSRKWYQPMLDWKEFAERNGIEIPETIDEFYADRN